MSGDGSTPGLEALAQAVAHETALLCDVADRGDLDATVTTCPDWTLTKLLVHVGRAHRWSAQMVRDRATEALPFDRVPDARPERTATGLRTWLVDGAAQLHGLLAETGSDAPVWTFAGPGTSGFWARRMAHETLVHRVDAQMTVGGPRGITAAAPELHADGLSEGLDLLTAVSDRAALAGRGEVLHVHATDGDLGEAGEWLVTRGEQGASWTHGHGRGDVAVRGPVHLVQAVMLRRLSADDERVEVLGERSVLDDWLAVSRF